MGEKVLVKIYVRKDQFSDRYDGLHRVLKKINPVTYLIEIDKNGKKQSEKKHIQQIKKYRVRSQIKNVYYYN